ncbi:hypothetical protein [Lutibacter sp.]|uniref:MSCRAMM family protein n=1 Tax=Lutibacter sp. TaxID=1925666 RepID=UPI0025C5F71D|nr:hypothetical protein [Lutibacter sp.]MCF6181540.1 hypothetical protein [Lutibacter sp.]
MKKIIFILIALFIFKLNAQNMEPEFEYTPPEIFFKQMFKDPSDQYLVAWSGAVKIVTKNKLGEEVQINGAIEPLEDYLNSELTNLARRQFKYNLNTPPKRISTPDKITWVGHCGYNPYTGVTFNDIMNGVIAGWPPEITSEVWGLHVSKKISVKVTYKNAETDKTELISVYFHANSIFYYHKIKPQNLKGKITRDDNYKACGKVKMHRYGPGNKKFNADTEVKGGDFEFNKKLFLGDYQVQYLWEDGTFQVLEQHIVYDPFGVIPDELEYELETFEGEISGTLVDKETHKPIKNQKVKLKPFCSESELPEKEKKTDGEGKFKFTEVPNGVYYVVTKGAPDTMAGLTKDPTLRLREIEVKQNSKYDIYATYTASGFAKAKLVWRAATIKFPEEDETPQFFDMVAFRNSGNYDNPTGTDGEPLEIPYTTIIPGIGKQTLYGWPENESAIPEVISVSSLGGKGVFAAFKVSLDEDALNTCNISQNNNGPIYLDLNFDLTGRYVRSDVWQQVDVGCKEDKEWNITKGNSLNGYPLAFKQLKFTEAEIEKFKSSEEFERILSNGKATLKIEFKLSEKE